MSLQISVLTYNIQHGSNLKGHYGLQKILHTIALSGADLVALQEVDCLSIRSLFTHQIRYLGKKLHMHYIFGTVQRQPAVGYYGNGILSRLPMCHCYNMILTKPPQEKEKRGLLKATLCTKTGESFDFFCTHLSLSACQRKREIHTIASILKKNQKPFLLAGDFNASASESVFLPLQGIIQNTANSQKKYATFPSSHPQCALDYIFASKHWQINWNYILKTQGSDHLPVLTSLTLPQL